VRKTPPVAAINDPTVIASIATSIMRRLPNMSASRETIGVATADISKVEVTSHDEVSGVTEKIPAKSCSSGTTKVCCSETTVPQSDRMPTMAQVGDRVAEPVGRRASAVVMTDETYSRRAPAILSKMASIRRLPAIRSLALAHLTDRLGVGRRLTALSAVVAVLTIALPASAASAHTSLKSSNPAAGSTVERAPGVIELVFAQEVSSPDPKITIMINGQQPVEVPATIDGATVRADLAGVDIPGEFTAAYPVSWKVGYRLVALDGDAFSGQITFTITTAPGPPAVTSTAEPTDGTVTSSAGIGTSGSGAVATTTTAPPTATAASAGPSTGVSLTGERTDSGGPTGWLITGIAVVLLVAAGVAVVLRQRALSGRG
jgi:copper resistance protein C